MGVIFVAAAVAEVGDLRCSMAHFVPPPFEEYEAQVGECTAVIARPIQNDAESGPDKSSQKG